LITIPDSDFLWFVDQALDATVAIVRELGDERANARPALPGANSPYAILTHCLGVMDYWAGHAVAGRRIARDREAEFRATGRVDDLIERVAAARRQLEADVATVRSLDAPRGALLPDDAAIPIGRTQGGVLLHIYEELQQHLGQMELTRDMLVARATR